MDSIFLPRKRKPFIALGGSATYVSLSAKRLGATVSIISKVGDDFPNAYLKRLKREGVDLSWVTTVKGAGVTMFELRYSNDLSSRGMRLLDRAPPITVDDLPERLRAKAVHVAPIAGEIPHEVVKNLRESADLLSIDPQGLVRRFRKDKSVIHVPLTDKRVLEAVDIYKSSLDEIKLATNELSLDSAVKAVHGLGVKTVIVTMGVKGAVLSVEGAVYNIPAYRPKNIVDPTGAGDAFIGGFLAEHVRGRDPIWCACVGSAISSIVVEHVGPVLPYGRDEVYRRAQVVEKGIKQRSICIR